MATQREVVLARKRAERLAKKLANWEKVADKPASGIPARKKETMEVMLQRQHARGNSLYGAAILMPEPDELAHAVGVVCANAQAVYERTEVQDAILLLETLGIRPAREEKKRGRATKKK